MTNHANHFANCAGCVSLDPEYGCCNGMNWVSGLVPENPFCHSPVLFQHPDGECLIYHDAESKRLVIQNENTGRYMDSPIGKLGILALGSALIALGIKRLEGE